MGKGDLAVEQANVLVVVLDTVRKDRLSVYGHDRRTTPYLETFAEEARVFEEAVAPAPWTLPVHASMFTGRYPSEHGATQESPYLQGETTLAETLSAAGYDTACYSSNAWITPYTNLTDGFDDQDNFFKVLPGDFFSRQLARIWRSMNDSDTFQSVAKRLVKAGNTVHEHLASKNCEADKTRAVVDRTMEFLDETDGPFFACINLMDAHLPYYPPAEYRDEFAPGVDPETVCQNSKQYNSGAYDIDEKEWNAIRGLYDAEIRHLDEQIERLFAWMRRADLWEDTMVVVCADHGELHGEFGLYGHEFAVYDPIVNVPLLVKHPQLEPERDHDQIVELQDLYHTILDHAAVDLANADLDEKRSLLSPKYRDFEGGEYAHVEYFRPEIELRQFEAKAASANIEVAEDTRFYSRMRALRSPEVMYIENERIENEAYRLDGGAGEELNVETAGEEIQAAKEALDQYGREIFDGWESDDRDLSGMDETTKDRLRELGYID